MINSSPTDKLNVVILNTKSKFVLERYEYALRLDGNAVIQIPDGWLDADIHACIYFTSANGKLNSTSQYIRL